MNFKNSVPLKTFRFFYETIIDLVYPPYCLFCQSDLNEGKDLYCDRCWDGLPSFPTDHDIMNEIKDKLRMPIYISDIKIIWEFKDNVQLIIHYFKYKNHRWLAKKIASYMANLIKLEHSLKNIDTIVPVPLHRKRKRKRGYNQSALISRAISQNINVPVDEVNLQRVKNTKSQTKLNFAQRLENVIDAFHVKDTKKIKGKTILLIDDVITTGSTINACAKQLILSNAKEVFALSVAKTM